jgi:hypothetical protein
MSTTKTLLAGKTSQSGLVSPEIVVTEADRIEPVTANEDIKELARREAAIKAFMDEIVVVKLHKSSDKNAATHTILSVNGMTQPIFRGRPTPLKRKYVEVLARMVESSYEQSQHPTDLERYEMIETAAPAYPFEVIRDDNPIGREWLDHILAERQ